MWRAALVLVLITTPLLAGTTDNDDSCDIIVAPAATLLLPIFDVDLKPGRDRGSDTLFTIMNVSAVPQIAHVTLWTDWAFPVLNFNVFLTGFDVQTISLYDLLVRGVVTTGGASRAPDASAGRYSAPLADTANPNIRSEERRVGQEG